MTPNNTAPLLACAIVASLGSPVAFANAQIVTHDIPGLNVYGAVNDSRACSVGGVWCNLGDSPLPWSATTAAHPVTATNLLRVENGALRQIGLSWACHLVTCPLQMAACATCLPEPGLCPGALGVGCSTTSTATSLGAQMTMGLRSLVNASTGTVPFPLLGPPITDALARRCRYAIADVEPAQHPNASFAVQTVTVAASGGDALQRSAVREVGGATLANDGSAFVAPTMLAASAVDFWRMVDPSVTMTIVDVPQDGRILVASRVASDPSGGYRYDYAIENLDSHESVGAFTVPIGNGNELTNLVFAAPSVHSGEVTSNAAWTATISTSSLTWATVPFVSDPNANAIRWGTTYSFGFLSPRAPATRDAHLTLFRSGDTMTIATSAPGPFADLDGDGSVNSSDLAILLGAWGRCPTRVFCPSDLDHDGTVGSADLALLLGDWTN